VRTYREAPELVAAAAARLVEIDAADDHASGAALLAIGAVGGPPAHHADGERLGDVLGDGEQVRHGLEGAPRVVLIEAGDDDALAAPRQPLAHPDQVGPEELALVDADDLGVAREVEDLLGVLDRVRGDAQLAVRHDVVAGVAVVDDGLEDLDALTGDLGPAQTADELFGLAAVHAADDDFDPALVREVRGGLGHGRGTLSEAPGAVNATRPDAPRRGSVP